MNLSWSLCPLYLFACQARAEDTPMFVDKNTHHQKNNNKKTTTTTTTNKQQKQNKTKNKTKTKQKQTNKNTHTKHTTYCFVSVSSNLVFHAQSASTVISGRFLVRQICLQKKPVKWLHWIQLTQLESTRATSFRFCSDLHREREVENEYTDAAAPVRPFTRPLAQIVQANESVIRTWNMNVLHDPK